jgi:hypothetical protein
MASPDTLRVGIVAVHQAIADHDDPQSKQMLSQALQILMKVQAQDHATAGPGGPGGGGAQAPLAARLMAGAGGPPAMPPGGPM